MQGLWTKTAASGFRMTAGTPSGRYGLPLGNRDGLRALTTRRLRVPLSGPGWSGASLAAGKENVGQRNRNNAPVRHRRTLPREWHRQAAAG